MATIPAEASSTAAPTSTTAGGGGEGRNNSSKLRQLKDRMWVREALEDITAAEFASSLSVETTDADAETGTERIGNRKEKKRPRKRAVDFDNVLNKLDARIEEMCVVSTPEIAKGLNQTCHILNQRRSVAVDSDGEESLTPLEPLCYSLMENVGMGCVVYTSEQREALLVQLIGSRERLMNKKESGSSGEDDAIGVIDDIRSQLQPPEDSTSPSEAEETTQPNGSESSSTSNTATTFDPSLYVRDDGTVDWDGALQDREALKKFGSVVWSRINGQDPEMDENGEESVGASGGAHGEHNKAVTAKIEETEAIRDKRDMLDALNDELEQMEEEHTKLLNSAISAGQAVANVNLATINASLRQRIRESSDELETKKAQVTFQTLNYELERIYTYLERELGNTAAKGYIPLQDRLNVAEFGLLESQVDNFHRQMDLGESLDSDVLSVVADQLVDFKRRLGIDYYVTGLTFDSEAIKVWLKDIWVKTNDGFTFYVKGTRLFSDDVVFCTGLILRALQGYTLKPREVRTLRRTFKDTITFIPVVIILVIPMTPIGHVLVFGAIQRVFPDFFPSCFTERRQNLLELYESTEYSALTINETWQQKLIRVSQAISILAVRQGTKLVGGDVEKSDENSDNQ
eukprot:CAMPEP_0172311194 /NCGR_PEP_ID=MMETSP1058-20130122/14101_1 /TAXON_ID=83371 /ORGANISM="Detonula confervacea, Strain CCMP 353" /LENGTH=630 /DNA_ID=CAMNT_0013024295 /DNA_START=350 /DNA_END=2242 /DNA_ORIENTATION=+